MAPPCKSPPPQSHSQKDAGVTRLRLAAEGRSDRGSLRIVVVNTLSPAQACAARVHPHSGSSVGMGALRHLIELHLSEVDPSPARSSRWISARHSKERTDQPLTLPIPTVLRRVVAAFFNMYSQTTDNVSHPSDVLRRLLALTILQFVRYALTWGGYHLLLFQVP